MLINAMYRAFKCLFLFFTNFIPFKATRRKSRAYFQNFQYKSKCYAFENNSKFENYLSIAACAYNEGPYLKEWIEYHRLLGIEKFYIVDNNSTDNTYEVLKPYIDKNIVVYERVYRDKSKDIQFWQRDIYSQIVKQCKKKTRYLAILDIDEFLVPKKHDNVIDFLKEYEAFSQITIHGRHFGFCGHKTKPDGLVIENYIYADKWGGVGKSIVNPRAILGKTQIHYSHVIGMPTDETKAPFLQDTADKARTYADIIQYNHYYSKSLQECFARRQNIDKEDALERKVEDEVLDESILKFVPKLKASMHN